MDAYDVYDWVQWCACIALVFALVYGAVVGVVLQSILGLDGVRIQVPGRLAPHRYEFRDKSRGIINVVSIDELREIVRRA
jgi:hypothetical protein